MLNQIKDFALQLISPRAAGRAKYETFRKLLASDRRCHELLAEIEELHYQRIMVDMNRLAALFEELSSSVAAMVDALDRLAPGSYDNLRDYYKKFDFYARFALAPPETVTSPPFLLPLQGSLHREDQVGGKGFHLSRLSHELGLPVPEGFVITTSAYQYVLSENHLIAGIREALAGLDPASPDSLAETAARLTEMILAATIPADLEEEILAAFDRLAGGRKKLPVAVRSSAVGEDSAVSFAGQYRSVLGADREGLLSAFREVLAGKFSESALKYRITHGLTDEATPMAVLVLAMVDARASGVLSTADPAGGRGNTLFLHAVPGLGEELVGGLRSPRTLELDRERQAPVAPPPGFPLAEEEIATLAGWGLMIESFYRGPQEIEWCLDRDGTLFVLQSRALSIPEPQENKKEIDTSGFSILLQGGRTASSGAAWGTIFLLDHEDGPDRIPAGAILVTTVTPPSLLLVLDRVAGVVAGRGSPADHFASVAREFGIPLLVDTGPAHRDLPPGAEATLWADGRKVFAGRLPELLETPSHPEEKVDTSPFRRTLKMVMDFISPLKLTKPADPAFVPESCRSFHDIIRFAHEKGVQTMFSRAKDGPLRKAGSRRLLSPLPLTIFLLDVGGGISKKAGTTEEIQPGSVTSAPFRALWQGLTNPGLNWRDHDHFDWKSFDEVALAGGVARKSDPAFASFAVISGDYVNLNLRFGYHFVLLDALCTPVPEENSIMLRFAGGGADFTGRNLRLRFLRIILTRLDFVTEQKGDLLDARLMRYDEAETLNRLDMLGRLLGATRLLDMILRDESMVDTLAEAFMNGRYDFSTPSP